MKYLFFFLAAFALTAGLTYGALAIETYTVQKGDTWQAIANKHNVSLSTLMAVNQPRPGARVNVPVIHTPPIVAPPVTTPPVKSDGEVRYRAYVTGYSYWDNTPPGSSDIALPTIHSKAGGTGTYADPITLAVGHVITNGKSTPDYPKGTRFYMPYLKRYFIVEDVCGDGSRPQDGPCHTGYPSTAKAWLDVWVDGRSSRTSSDKCMSDMTGVYDVIENPAPTYEVTVGAVCK